MAGVSGRSILNLETILSLAILIVLLSRAKPGIPQRAGRFELERTDIFAIVSVALLAVLVFWGSLRSYFLSDDFILLTTAPGNHSGLFTRGGGDGFFRPLGYLSLYWTWPWAKVDPARWHGVALLLHIANSALVYFLAAEAGFRRAYAWLASALFALHGAHPEAVVWVAGRFDVLATAFVLISLLAFGRFRVRPSAGAFLVAAFAMTAGILTKESAYATPLMMAVLTALPPQTSWRQRIRSLTPFFFLAAGLFAYRWILQGGIGGYVTAEGTPQMFSLNPVSLAKALLLRLWAILFFPIDWAAPASAWLLALSAAFALAWLAIAWTAKQRSGLALGIGFAMAAAIPPVSQLLIGADLQKARLLYLPSVGFCLLAAAAVETAAPKLRAAAGAVMLAFSFAALVHNLNIWETVAAKSKTVCEALSACSNPQVTGLPRSLEGVYFFANGLAECARLEHSQNPDAPQHSCSLAWDEKTSRVLNDRLQQQGDR